MEHWVSYVLRILLPSTCAWEAGHDQTLAPPRSLGVCTEDVRSSCLHTCIRTSGWLEECVRSRQTGEWTRGIT